MASGSGPTGVALGVDACRVFLVLYVNIIYFLNMVLENSVADGKHSPRVQRKRLERQQKIIETAMALLAEGGLENVTVGRLAKKLDYTPGALYRYFPSMEVLLSHMQRRAIASLHAQILAALAPLDGPGLEVERLRAVASSYLAATVGERAHELSLIGQMLASPTVLIADPIASQTAPPLIALLLLVERLITEAQDACALAPGIARVRAVQLWAALQGAISLSKLSRFDSSLFSAQIIGEGLLEDLLVAWAAVPATDTSI